MLTFKHFNNKIKLEQSKVPFHSESFNKINFQNIKQDIFGAFSQLNKFWPFFSAKSKNYPSNVWHWKYKFETSL